MAEEMWTVPSGAFKPCMAHIVRELEDALIEHNATEYMNYEVQREHWISFLYRKVH